MDGHRILIISGLGCFPVRKFSWYSWLEKELQKRKYNVHLPQMCDPHAARESRWVPFIRERLTVDEKTILIGHSSGCQAIMRVIEQDKVFGVILVAACHTDFGHPKEKASEYFDRPWNWDAMRKNTKWIVQFHSPTDILVPVEEGRFVAEKLKSEFIEPPDAGHFTDEQFPELIKIIEEKCPLKSQ